MAGNTLQLSKLILSKIGVKVVRLDSQLWISFFRDETCTD